MIVLIIILSASIINVNCARILAVIPTAAVSHQIVFRPLTQELARRGHKVTIITTDPAYPRGEAPNNLREIDVHDVSYETRNEATQKIVGDITYGIDTLISVLVRTTGKVFASQVATEEIQDIINKKDGEYDLLMLEACAKPALIFSHIFKAPVILVSSFGGMEFNYRAVGASMHPLLYPSISHQRLYNLTNWEKLQELYNHWSIENEIYEIEHEHDMMLKSLFGADVPSLQELANNVGMLFLNVNPIWVDNQPVPPSVVYIGGIHVTPSQPLPQDLQHYLDSSKHGVIYFSFGTYVQTSLLPVDKVQMFIKVFSQLRYDVLWKWDGDELPGKSNNIKIFKWLPQSDLLKHPNVKLFITQGGLQSTDEAINAGVPLIGIPMVADQWYNVEKYVYHKIGIRLDLHSLTEQNLKNAIENVIEDESYRESVIKLRGLMADQPETPLERAVWWTEHVLRHGDAGHLRAAGANLSQTEYLELELIFVLLSTFIIILVIQLISIYLFCKRIK